MQKKTNADTNPGEHAFDQPESRILKDLMESFKPHFYLDLHAGFRGMFFPNDVANDDHLSMQLQRLFAPVDEAHCKCPLGVANKEVGYHTAGSALDYSFSVLKVPVSMAVEVYLNDEATDEIAALEERWDKEKGELLKPLKTGSSFMENGVSANTIIPMPVIPSVRDLMQQNGAKMTPDQCMKYFNPVKKESYMQTLKSWTVAIAEMSIKSREIKKDAAFVALNKGSSFTELRPPMHQVQQSAAGCHQCGLHSRSLVCSSLCTSSTLQSSTTRPSSRSLQRQHHWQPRCQKLLCRSLIEALDQHGAVDDDCGAYS